MARNNQTSSRFGGFKAKIGSFFSRIGGAGKTSVIKSRQFIARKPFWSFFLALLLLLILIVLGSTVFKTKPLEQSEQIAVKDVKTFKIGTSPKVSTQAQVEKTGVIKVVAQMPGIVSSINVMEGDQVGKGQVLINMASNYQGGNALSISRQVAQTQNNLAKETYDTQKDLIQKTRDQAERTDANSDQLRDIANRSLEESRSLLDINEALLSPLNQVLSQQEATNSAGVNQGLIAQTNSQRVQLLSVINQLRQAIRSSEFSSASDRPPAQLSDLQREIALKNLDIQEKTLEANKQISQLQYQAALVTEAQMYPAAPFAATVERVHVRYGEAVSPGTVLVTLTQTTDEIILDAKVPAAMAKNLSRFEKSVVHVGGKTLELDPYYVSSEATDGQLYSVLYVLEDSYKELFTDKSFVQIDIPVGSPDTNSIVPFIPLDAVFQTQDESVIYVVENGQAKSKKVQLGEVQGRFVAVSEGISEQDEVILSRTVVEGDQVKVQ
jgi:biotin carboxyl carrier protein